jgi:hypothetical protein
MCLFMIHIGAHPLLSSRFRKSAERICNFIQEEGVLIRPYAKESLPYFNQLSPSEQEEAVRDITLYEQICQDVKAAHGSLKDNQLFIKKALKRFNWSVRPEDLMKIADDHIVEIYDLKQTQVFRSFRYFEFCSYTIEDVHCRKWWHLYTRNASDQEFIFHEVDAFLNQPTPQARRLPMRATHITETDTLERLSMSSTIEWFLPVLDGEKLAGIMTVIKSQLESGIPLS